MLDPEWNDMLPIDGATPHETCSQPDKTQAMQGDLTPKGVQKRPAASPACKRATATAAILATAAVAPSTPTAARTRDSPRHERACGEPDAKKQALSPPPMGMFDSP